MIKINKLLFVPPIAVAVVFSVVSIFSSFNDVSISKSRLQTTKEISTKPSGIYNDSDTISDTNLLIPESQEKMGMMDYYYPNNDRISTSTERYYNTDASITLEAKNIEETSQQVMDLVKNNKGILDNYSVNEGKNYGNSYITFRVPQENMTEVTRKIKALGYKVIAQNINIQDQTVQVEDKEDSTTKNTNYYQRLIDNLTQDLLNPNLNDKQRVAIENQIANYKSIIDSMDKNVEDLKTGLSYATLTVSIEKEQGFLTKLSSGTYGGGYINDLIQSGSIAFVVLGMLLRFVGHLFIWSLVFGIAWLPIWLVIRYFKNRNIKV